MTFEDNFPTVSEVNPTIPEVNPNDEYNVNIIETIPQNKGFALAGLFLIILSFLFIILSITINNNSTVLFYFAIASLLCFVIGIIFSIIALIKKQKYKWLSIVLIPISLLMIFGLLIPAIGNNKPSPDSRSSATIEAANKMETYIKQHPELDKLMQDPTFNKLFNDNFKKRRNEKLSEYESFKAKESDKQKVSDWKITEIQKAQQLATEDTLAQFKK